ncbi:MAG: hypothetical protein L6R42_010925 [Xanthoria sp. 1 TBL-2021]|nr:MAG: hypothetical protein L6R42_010925 [Xanthoria sp. 1 TBL-2021]
MLASTAKEQSSSGWRSSQPSTLEHALKPVTSSVTNAAASAAYKNPLKRTASQVNGANQQVNKATLSRSSSMLGKLHDDVYFDENDFEDDDNIDLTDAVTATLQTPPAASQYPGLLLLCIIVKVLHARTQHLQ